MKKRIYLACPYSHPDKNIEEERFLKATAKAIELMEDGLNVYSPLTYGHLMATLGNLPPEFAFWEKSCLSFIENWATDMYILTIEGYDQSKGIKAELEKANSLGIPVTYIDF